MIQFIVLSSFFLQDYISFIFKIYFLPLGFSPSASVFGLHPAPSRDEMKRNEKKSGNPKRENPFKELEYSLANEMKPL
jgi:hypothetical protein